MFGFQSTKGASRVTSMLGDDASVMTDLHKESTPEEEDARMLNAIFSASVDLQDAFVSNGILSGE
jgi:hypothetical protein